MTIIKLVVIFALVIGAGTNQSIESNSTIESTSTCPIGYSCKIGNNCWINGVWYNPCPSDATFPPTPEPSPETLLP